ncbi:MAG: DUF6775 family putative metallopeptidase [Nitrosopumilus sp.]
MKINKIILYDEPKVPELQIKKIEKFLKRLFSVEIEVRENIFQHSGISTHDEIAKTRIFNLKKPFKKQSCKNKKILFQEDNQEITLHDGFELQKIITEAISEKESILGILHVIFTDYLIGTFDEEDFRYHARAMIGANPTVISITGVIEAPAKPKQYYLEQITNSFLEKNENIRKKYKGEFLEYHDLRISEVIEGYVLQAIIYHETGDAFCTDKCCRLYNSHWQKDLLFSQIENKQFCKKHLEILSLLKN